MILSLRYIYDALCKTFKHSIRNEYGEIDEVDWEQLHTLLLATFRQSFRQDIGQSLGNIFKQLEARSHGKGILSNGTNTNTFGGREIVCCAVICTSFLFLPSSSSGFSARHFSITLFRVLPDMSKAALGSQCTEFGLRS